MFGCRNLINTTKESHCAALFLDKIEERQLRSFGVEAGNVEYEIFCHSIIDVCSAIAGFNDFDVFIAMSI